MVFRVQVNKRNYSNTPVRTMEARKKSEQNFKINHFNRNQTTL